MCKPFPSRSLSVYLLPGAYWDFTLAIYLVTTEGGFDRSWGTWASPFKASTPDRKSQNFQAQGGYFPQISKDKLLLAKSDLGVQDYQSHLDPTTCLHSKFMISFFPKRHPNFHERLCKIEFNNCNSGTCTTKIFIKISVKTDASWYQSKRGGSNEIK